MTLTIIILAITACLANFLMDEIKCKYYRFFGRIIPLKLEWWFNPALSHVNKWRFDSKLLDVLFSTVLVWTTDFWHFLKLIFLGCVGMIILLMENSNLRWWQYGIELLSAGLLWCVLWETFSGIAGVISDKMK